MKNPVAFVAMVLLVLLCAGAATYFFGLPMLYDLHVGCRVGGGKTMGCSSSFGTFITLLVAGSAVAIGIIWNRFGR